MMLALHTVSLKFTTQITAPKADFPLANITEKSNRQETRGGIGKGNVWPTLH